MKLEEAENLLPQVLEHLYKNKTQSLMVEGGAILQSFIAAGLWDEARVITNNSMYAGAGIKAPVLENAALYKKNNQEQTALNILKQLAIMIISSGVLYSVLISHFRLKCCNGFISIAFQAIVFNYIACVCTGAVFNGSFPVNSQAVQSPWFGGRW